MNQDSTAQLLAAYTERRHEFELFKRSVYDYFALHPKLNNGPLPAVHSLKARLKDVAHLRDKLERKSASGTPVSGDTLFRLITDLAGVRVLHLHQGQFIPIHNAVMARVSSNDWTLAEDPIAYSWDPEARQFYEQAGLKVLIKDSFYTSIHYVVRPRSDSDIACEIQVRTMFEEIWGEIDHAINYPHPTSLPACRDQIRVLARLVSTGTRLADSIFSSFAVPSPSGPAEPRAATAGRAQLGLEDEAALRPPAAEPVPAPDPPPGPPPDDP